MPFRNYIMNNNLWSFTAIFGNAGVGLIDGSSLNWAVAFTGVLVMFIANSHKMYVQGRDFYREVSTDWKNRKARKNKRKKDV